MEIAEILKYYRESIIEEWVRRLHWEVSPAYSAEKIETLNYTCSSAYDANFAAFAHNDFSAIDMVIERIGNLRGRAGFPLSDVQKAFEIYRSVLMPILISKSDQSTIGQYAWSGSISVSATRSTNSAIISSPYRQNRYGTMLKPLN